MTDTAPQDAHAALALVDRRFDDMVAFLRELVRVPSDNPPGDCAPHARRAKELLEGLGFNVEAHAVPQDVVAANGMISATNLIVRHRFGDGPTIAFNAHGDVVPPGEGWTADPYAGEVRDGWMYGRGAAVSKSDFATYAFALRALIDAGVPLAGSVELHLTYDEETGGHVGPQWLIQSGLTKPDYAVSAAFSYAVITAHNGCVHLEVEVKGKSAHAAMPDTGHDAIAAAAKLVDAVYAYSGTLAARRSSFPGIAHPTCIVGLISGGINTNVVADRVKFRIDRRITPDERGADAEAELRAALERAAAAIPGITIDVRRILLAEPFRPVPGADRIAAVFCRRATEILGEPVTTTAVPLYTDARHYSEAGISTIMYGAGPRTLLEANGHRADERLPLETLRAATKVTILATADLLAPGRK